jgi:hypothetical protein
MRRVIVIKEKVMKLKVNNRYFKMSTRYWLGPYGIRIPNHIEIVTAADGGNMRYKDGGETEMGVMDPPTKDEYLNKYAILQRDGNYYWKEDGYWLGPYDIKIPNYIGSVKAEDGGNIQYKDGAVTEMYFMNPLTKEEYLNKYAVLKKDGYYYWK